MCAKYYELRYIFKKIAPRQSWRVFAWNNIKNHVIFVVRLGRLKSRERTTRDHIARVDIARPDNVAPYQTEVYNFCAAWNIRPKSTSSISLY